MQTFLYILIGLAVYTFFIYLAIKDKKAIFIGLIEMSALFLMIAASQLISIFILKETGYNPTLALGGFVAAVALKLYLSPVYRLPDGFVMKDRPFRKSDYPKIDFDGHQLVLYKHVNKSKKNIAHRIELTGPLKQRNKELIQSVYQN